MVISTRGRAVEDYKLDRVRYSQYSYMIYGDEARSISLDADHLYHGRLPG